MKMPWGSGPECLGPERQRRGTLWPTLAATLCFLLLSVAPALAQGCAMCYTSAAGASKDGQKAISKGVVVLLAPPLGFMTVGMGMAVRYSRKRDEECGAADEGGEG